jgi:perosamine synthetase
LIPLFKVFTADDAYLRVKEVLDSGFTGQGPKCEEFETKFQKLVESEQRPLLVNSCTSALDLVYHLIGLKAGDLVAVPPQTCVASASPLVHRGVNIIWADIDPLYGTIDPESVVKIIREYGDALRAIVTVDWGGRACDYYGIGMHADALGIPIVEDAAHGPLIKYAGESVSYVGGDYVAYSHQSIKFLSMADGGSLIVPKHQYERAKLLRWYGLDRESSSDFRCAQNITSENFGFKYQSNDVAATIGLANIEHTENLVLTARRNAALYADLLYDVPGLFAPPANEESSWWLYTLVVTHKTKTRDELKEFLLCKGIASSQVHRRLDEHEALSRFRRGPLPGLDYFSSRSLAVPCGWWCAQEQIEYISNCIKEFFDA